VLNFLYIAVSWVLLRWHQLFTAIGLPENSGVNWTLSIVFLVITARLLLFRMFIKQIHYQRHMQLMQPKIQKLREKYKDKAEMQREMMKLQQEEGFNPLSGCLPILLQFPVFIGLLHVLRHLSAAAANTYQNEHKDRLSLYGFTAKQTISAARARIFGGAPLAAELRDTEAHIKLLGGEVTTTRIVIVFLVVFSAAATYTTQRLVKTMATTTPVGTAATMQKLMLYMIPVFTLGSGLFFPLGVLLYWFTSNIWTAGQQAYVIRFHPHTPTEVPVTGELGKTLAPKPGVRPQRDKTKTSLIKTVEAGDFDGGDAAPPPPTVVPRAAPRPGQKPNRPAGNRPAAKRPTRSKKRR
jgi:YidC/Oxa1 family membrane protein insertase